MAKSLWTEKYRPKTVNGYVFRDGAQRKQVEQWVKDKTIPHLLFSGNAGIGKAQPLDSKVLTPGGWETMENISAGTEVIASDGTTSKVIGVYPQGIKEIYSIKFNDGRKVEACKEHLWKIWDHNLQKWRLLSTSEIDNTLRNTKKKLYVPLFSGAGIDKELPLAPYFLGAFLGDGCLRKDSFGFTSKDRELIDKLTELTDVDYEFSLKPQTKYDYRLRRKEDKRSNAKVASRKNVFRNKYKSTFFDLGLIGCDSKTKFIPSIYKEGSVTQKEELIAGLVDTDGYVSGSGSISISTSSMQLASDIKEVIESIGGIAKIREKRPTYKYLGERKEGSTSYTVSIRYRTPRNLSRLSRKKNRIPTNYQYRDLKLRIESVELTRKAEAKCIMIDHKDHLYVTDRYIVTHNTTLAKLLFNELDINPLDILEINASRTNSVDDVRDKIVNFVQMIPFGDFKVVLLDEADYLSPNAQAALRGVMEEYHETARFILTCVTGDSKVITPEGMKRIDTITPNTTVRSFDSYLNSVRLKQSVSKNTRVIKTEHGFEVKVTPEHKFYTITGEKTANQLSVGDRIPIYVDQLYGNMFDAQEVDYKECFSKLHFSNWLKSKKILTNEQKNWLLGQKKFIFNKSHSEIFNYIIDNNLKTINLVELGKVLDKTRASVRNLFRKLSTYIIDKRYTSVSNFVYEFDLSKMKSDYYEFTNFVEQQGINTAHINQIANTYITVEQIINSLKFDYLDPDLLLSLGRVIGFIEGDGHLSTTLHLAAKNSQTLVKVHQDLSKFVDVKYNHAKNGRDTKGLCSYYNNKPLKLFLEYLGVTVGNKSHMTRKVPELAKYKLFFKGYLQGFYDADGKSIQVLNDRKSVSPVLLTQSIVNSDQLELFNEIAEYAKLHFGIELSVSKKRTSVSSFGGSEWNMQLYSGASAHIERFLSAIGHYYDKTKNSDVLGYLKYKSKQPGNNFLSFDEWRQEFYGHGVINDRIVSIEDVSDEVKVYDCCLEEVHWYLTNGFMSHNCNYPNRIIPALHSRCQGFHIAKIDQTEFTARVAQILIDEGISPELDVLDTYVKATYPDLRKCINMVQMNSQDGKLLPPHEGDAGEQDWKVEMVELFKAGKIQAARKKLCGAVRPEEMEEIYRWLYANIELFGADNRQQDQAVLIIKQGLVDHALVADPEINLAAVLIRLARNLEG